MSYPVNDRVKLARRYSIMCRWHGADDPRAVEAKRALELARLDAARAEVARLEAELTRT